MTEAEDFFHLQNTANWDKWGHPPIIAWNRSKFREHFDDPEEAFAASGRLGIGLSVPLLVRHAFPNCLYSSGAHFFCAPEIGARIEAAFPESVEVFACHDSQTARPLPLALLRFVFVVDGIDLERSSVQDSQFEEFPYYERVDHLALRDNVAFPDVFRLEKVCLYHFVSRSARDRLVRMGVASGSFSQRVLEL